MWQLVKRFIAQIWWILNENTINNELRWDGVKFFTEYRNMIEDDALIVFHNCLTYGSSLTAFCCPNLLNTALSRKSYHCLKSRDLKMTTSSVDIRLSYLTNPSLVIIIVFQGIEIWTFRICYKNTSRKGKLPAWVCHLNNSVK